MARDGFDDDGIGLGLRWTADWDRNLRVSRNIKVATYFESVNGRETDEQEAVIE
jgi:hypothetical protein